METMSDYITVRSTETGEVFPIRKRLFNSKFFNNGTLIEAKEGDKSFLPETYKAKTPEEFAEVHPDKVVESKEDEKKVKTNG